MEYGDAVLTSAKAARLQVADVRFGYLPERDVLAGVDFVIEPGRTVAMVGPTGSGKSTMTTLLTRLIDPEEGAVKLDGVDLRDLARDQLAGSVALVAQTAFLFDDTIRGNITLGGDYSDEDVWDALRIAQGDGFVKGLPHGLDTKVGERGTTLSGGQRQRIALARALVRRPRLLILDDATSAVDPQVEARDPGRAAVRGAGRRSRDDRARDRLPEGDDLARRRGAVPRRGPDRGAGDAHRPAGDVGPPTATWSTPTRRTRSAARKRRSWPPSSTIWTRKEHPRERGGSKPAGPCGRREWLGHVAAGAEGLARAGQRLVGHRDPRADHDGRADRRTDRGSADDRQGPVRRGRAGHLVRRVDVPGLHAGHRASRRERRT